MTRSSRNSIRAERNLEAKLNDLLRDQRNAQGQIAHLDIDSYEYGILSTRLNCIAREIRDTEDALSRIEGYDEF